MKRLSKIMVTCTVFLLVTVAVYATTDILPENKFGIKKVAILGAGVFLVVQILYIAYKSDKALENALVKENKTEDKELDIIQINEQLEKEFVVNNAKNIVPVDSEDTVKEVKLEKIDSIKTEKIEVINPIEKVEQVQVIESVTKDCESEEKNLLAEELEKIKKEEENLFTAISTETKIETIPDKNLDHKKNIVLEKEIKLAEKVDKPINVRRSSRGSVKIVRERKNRFSQGDIRKEEIKEQGETKKKKTKIETEIKKQEIKDVTDMKKRTKKVTKEIKKQK